MYVGPIVLARAVVLGKGNSWFFNILRNFLRIVYFGYISKEGTLKTFFCMQVTTNSTGQRFPHLKTVSKNEAEPAKAILSHVLQLSYADADVGMALPSCLLILNLRTRNPKTALVCMYSWCSS